MKTCSLAMVVVLLLLGGSGGKQRDGEHDYLGRGPKHRGRQRRAHDRHFGLFGRRCESARGRRRPIVVNGVPFADTATGYLSPFAGSDTKPFNDADTGVPLSASYHDLLDGCFYNGFAGTPTVTIGGLTVGQQYLIQLWANFCPTTRRFRASSS